MARGQPTRLAAASLGTQGVGPSSARGLETCRTTGRIFSVSNFGEHFCFNCNHLPWTPHYAGPEGRNVKLDPQGQKRDGRLHLPAVLEGVNHYLTDRIDGLITDSTNSPFTTAILPYQYLSNPDAKFTWNRYSFDEGLASRVPYESAARTLAQTRKSYEGYTVRQGLAVTMEHNFMMSPAGRENFFNKWWQVFIIFSHFSHSDSQDFY